MIQTALLLAAMALSTAPARPPIARPVRVYVFTHEDPSGLIDRAQAARAAAVKDVEAACSKEKTIALVQSPTRAALTIEVLRRRMASTDPRVAGSVRGPSGASQLAVIEVRLRLGSYGTTIVGKSDGRILHQWQNAARDVARQIDAWIAANRDQLEKTGDTL